MAHCIPRIFTPQSNPKLVTNNDINTHIPESFISFDTLYYLQSDTSSTKYVAPFLANELLLVSQI